MPAPFSVETITVEILTLADLEAAIESFKTTCRPRRRGRPSKTGERHFRFGALTVTFAVGESCLGAGGWGMTSRLFLDGKRTTLRKIAEAHLATR
jgi:hypothetical protein